jgi:pimeloyl-ACP methyl ester carboxylesterase
MQIVVNSLMTQYSLSGNGKLLFVLHGWGDSSQGILQLVKALSTKYKVLSVDLPGFGKTDAPPFAWDLDDYATFIQSFITKLDLSQPYAVVGHSNGGALAIRAIGTGKLMPRRLVLLGASGIRNGNTAKRTSMMLLAKTGKASTFWLPLKQRSQLQKRLYGSAGSDMLVVPQLKETFKNIVKQDVQADARALKLPTLLVYGAKDTATPPQFGKIYQNQIAGSRLEILHDSGHFVHIDQPQETLNLIREFLE